MRCFNCGFDNLSKATFCEKCGTRLVLPPLETQPAVLNTGQGRLFGIIPRVALIPFIGLAIGAIAFVMYIIGFMIEVHSITDTAYDPWTNLDSGAEALMLVSYVVGAIGGVIFMIGLILMIRKSD